MEQFKRILGRILYPGRGPSSRAFLAIVLAAAGIGVLTFIFMTGRDASVYASISYPFILYGMTVLVLGFPNIIKQTKAFISRNKYGNIYLNDDKLRAKISLYQGLFVNLLFVAFYVFTSWRYSSVWFGAVAGYYIVLSGIRFVLLRSVRKTRGQDDRNKRYIGELKTYRFCGYLMIALISVMSGMIIQMIWQNKGYVYSGITIFVSATYAFYQMIIAIMNMIKFRKMENPSLSAAKMIGFAGALMSMYALQTAMITQFGIGQETFKQIMNGVTGASVFLIVLLMAVYMVIRASKMLKKLAREQCSR